MTARTKGRTAERVERRLVEIEVVPGEGMDERGFDTALMLLHGNVLALWPFGEPEVGEAIGHRTRGVVSVFSRWSDTEEQLAEAARSFGLEVA